MIPTHPLGDRCRTRVGPEMIDEGRKDNRHGVGPDRRSCSKWATPPKSNYRYVPSTKARAASKTLSCWPAVNRSAGRRPSR